MNLTDYFWNASLEELKRGYREDKDYYVCILCGKEIEKGIIYPEDGLYYEGEKYMQRHIEKAHQSVFAYLIKLDKKLTGLTDHQNNLLKLFYQGKSDGEVQKEMGIGSSSTIRNHRFALKEKERQAKVFLTLMELLKEKDKNAPKFFPVHKKARMIDDRYNITLEEGKKVLAKYLPQGSRGPLTKVPLKEKEKLIILRAISANFREGKNYSEKDVNELLAEIHEDYITLRRYLVEYGFLERKPDGSSYWLTQSFAKKGEDKMDRKKELKQQYQEIKTQGGIYQIRNTKTEKIFVVSTPNFKTINGRKMELNSGGFRNKELQEDWQKYGEEAFAFEILEVLEEKDDPYFNKKDELKRLEEKWLAKLQPYGERGYNRPKKINNL